MDASYKLIATKLTGSYGNSGTVCTRRHDPLQVDMPRSLRGAVRRPRTCPLLTVDADIGVVARAQPGLETTFNM